MLSLSKHVNAKFAATPFALTMTILFMSMLMLGACGDQIDVGAKSRLDSMGFSPEAAKELSTLELTDQELIELQEAGQAGLDGTAAVEIVRSLHKRDLRFDLGMETRLLLADSLGSTALTQLVELGAIPRWTDDLRALKQAGVGDVTLIELERLRSQENKELLSGGEYASLKQRGMSDAGLLTFVRNGGTQQQLQTV